MRMPKGVMEKVKYNPVKAHQQYFLKSGELVPGVTTIKELSGFSKPMLIAWARREAMAGNDPSKVKDKAASIGSAAHFLIECHTNGQEADMSEFSQAVIEKAANCLLGFLEWEKQVKFKKVATEIQMVSETLRYGGTADCVGRVNGEQVLLDYKTGKNVYMDDKVQIAAYVNLWNELQIPPDPPRYINTAYLLHLGKEDGKFEVHKVDGQVLRDAFDIFLLLRKLYDYKSYWK